MNFEIRIGDEMAIPFWPDHFDKSQLMEDIKWTPDVMEAVHQILKLWS